RSRRDLCHANKGLNLIQDSRGPKLRQWHRSCIHNGNARQREDQNHHRQAKHYPSRSHRFVRVPHCGAVSQYFHLSDFASSCIESVAGAGHAGIVRVDSTQNLERLRGVSYWISKKRCFVGPGNSLLVARTCIPSSWNYGLIVGENALVDDYPVGERSARCLVHSNTSNFVLGEFRRVVGGGVAAKYIVGQQLTVFDGHVR